MNNYNKPKDTDFIMLTGEEFKIEEIKQVLSKFNLKVETDDLLKFPFQSVHNSPEHIERLTHFWWTSLHVCPI